MDGERRWSAELQLQIERKGGRSIVSDSCQRGPLTVQSPFYPEDDVCHLYLLHPPAGIVGGDSLVFRVSASTGGSAVFTTPGATKFYRTNGNPAIQEQYITVHAESSVEWLPQETILYPDTDVRVETVVNLEGNGHYLGWDIYCLGMPASGHGLANGKARMKLSIYRDTRPLLIETLIVNREKQRYQAALLRGAPICGTFVSTACTDDLLRRIRQECSCHQDGLWGATLINDILVIRYVGDSVGEARVLFQHCWQLIRPVVLEKKSCFSPDMGYLKETAEDDVTV